MSDGDLARLLADFYRRRALGEEPAAADYRERAGDRFGEFERLLKADAEVDQSRDSFEPRSLPLRFGPYLLLRELGRGAVGVVYEAIHRRLGRTVAIKVLRTGFDTHPTALERFRREARACAQIRHDHIVKVYEAGEHRGRPFCAMELVSGRTLHQLRRDGGLPGHARLADGLAGIADALHVLHEGGIVHRDVKPSNIMVADDGRMRLADFGLARTVASVDLTRTGEALGTPIYMSPEQLLADRGRVDGRTDVYCLGATLYEMLTGGPVFTARNPGEMMRQILTQPPEPPSARDPRVPAALDAIALRALAKKRRDRYPDAAAMAGDLRRFARGETVAPPQRLARRGTRRRPWRWLALAGAGVVAFATALWLVLAAALWPDPIASVSVRAIPVAEAFLDGETAGATPFDGVVKAGSLRLRLVCDGFEPIETTLDLASGEAYSGLFVLRPRDEADPAALARLARGFGLHLTRLDPEPGPTERSGNAASYAFLPRGDVALAELRDIRIEFGEFLGEGRLVFVVDGETVFGEPYNDWTNTHWRDRMPAAVRARLQPGSEVEWGIRPDDGSEFARGRFRVVDGAAADARSREIATAIGDKAPVAAAQLQAQVYLDAGRWAAVVTTLEPLLEDVDLPVAWILLDRALTALDLRDSPLGVRTQHHTRALREAE